MSGWYDTNGDGHYDLGEIDRYQLEHGGYPYQREGDGGRDDSYLSSNGGCSGFLDKLIIGSTGLMLLGLIAIPVFFVLILLIALVR